MRDRGKVGASMLGASALLACSLALGACHQQPAHDLSTEQLSFVVQAQQPNLQRCYEAALARTPYKQEMRMQAVLDIATSGRVSSIKVEGGGGLPGMNKCITDEIKRWQFPEAQDPTATSLPLIFRPEVKKTGGPDLKAFKELIGGPPVRTP